MVDEELKDKFVGGLGQTPSLQDWREESAAMRRENIAMHEELRRHMDTAFEGLRHDIRRILDSLSAIDEKFTARMDEKDRSVDQRFADTHAMIKFAREHPHRPARRQTKPN